MQHYALRFKLPMSQCKQTSSSCVPALLLLFRKTSAALLEVDYAIKTTRDFGQSGIFRRAQQARTHPS